ncbi:MAG: hypothetical protein P8Z30_16200 [Acidobacteriota bacterium]
MPKGFPIPSRVLQLSKAVTPHEYDLLKSAITSHSEQERAGQKQTLPLFDPHFDEATAYRIGLGELGEGLVLYFGHSTACGVAGNCPISVFARGPGGYRMMISSSGGGAIAVPSGGPVPDVVAALASSVSSLDLFWFRYSHGRFAPSKGVPKECTPRNASNEVCAALGKLALPSASPADYSALRKPIEACLQAQSPAQRTSFNQARAVTLNFFNNLRAIAIGLGGCVGRSNCRISIYARDPQTHRVWPMLTDATGWGVANYHEPSLSFGKFRYVIVSRFPSDRYELTLYVGKITWGHAEPQPGDKLMPEACEIVMPREGSWPARWDSQALKAIPVPCAKKAGTSR